MTVLSPLLKTIEESGTFWEISRDEVFALTDTDITEAYRKLHRVSHPLIRFNRDFYTLETGGELVSLLEILGFETAADDFWERGLWVPVDIQIELQRYLMEAVRHRVDLHTPDYSGFVAMFESSRNFIDATEIYIDRFFPREDIIERAVEYLIDDHPETMGVRVRPLLTDLAGELFRRSLIPYRNLFAAVMEELYQYLAALGYYGFSAGTNWYEQGYGEDDSAGDDASRQMQARERFGFSLAARFTSSELKKRYKSLMLKYHPDVNAGGTEAAKEINAAYLILKELAD